MSKFIVFVAAILFSSAAWSQDRPNPCNNADIAKLQPKSCKSTGTGYFTPDGKAHAGELLELYMGEGPHFDMPNPQMLYFFQTADYQMVALDKFPQRIGHFSVDCIMNSLSMPPAMAGGTSRYEIRTFANERYLLKDGKLYTEYMGKSPFVGSTKTLDNSVCTGDLKFDNKFVEWHEAVRLCETAFTKAVGPAETGYSNTPKMVALNEDVSGFHYLCSHIHVPDHNSNKYEVWYYWLDMEKDKNPQPIFLKKEIKNS